MGADVGVGTQERVCVDASLYVHIMMPDEQSDLADARWEAWLEEGLSIHAPGLFLWECLNALRRAVVCERLSEQLAAEARSVLLSAPISLASMGEKAEEVWSNFVLVYDLPTVYDAVYLAAAADLGCELWTEDRRLYRTVHEHLPWVRCASLEI
ncbi:MAG: PIN domain-containing protein [Armatimonadia bacterium]|nr:PIN domain-containing protein [Armatimonadia bacterium]